MSAKDINSESFSIPQTPLPVDNVYSGPFSINKKSYNVDESLFLQQMEYHLIQQAMFYSNVQMVR